MRFSATVTTCPYESEGGIFAAAQWQPSGLRYIWRPLDWVNIHIELGARGGIQGKIKYSECSGLQETKICGRVEAFGWRNTDEVDIETDEAASPDFDSVLVRTAVVTSVSTCVREMSRLTPQSITMRTSSSTTGISIAHTTSGAISLAARNSVTSLSWHC